MDAGTQQTSQQPETATPATDSSAPVGEIVTKAEYARRKDWDRSYLSQPDVLEKIAPAIVVVKKPGKKDREMINVDLADRIFAKETDLSKVRKEIPGDDSPPAGSFTDTKNQREKLKLEKETLELLERKKQTLPRSSTLAAVSIIGASMREHLQARNRRIAEQASTMTDAREIKTMLDLDDRAMLEMISHDFMRRVQPETDGDGQSIIN